MRVYIIISFCAFGDVCLWHVYCFSDLLSNKHL